MPLSGAHRSIPADAREAHGGRTVESPVVRLGEEAGARPGKAAGSWMADASCEEADGPQLRRWSLMGMWMTDCWAFHEKPEI